MSGTAGPNVRRALALPVTGTKRRKVFVAIALFADGGRADPSISEIAERAKLSRCAVVSIVDMLDRVGLLEVTRGDHGLGQRNVYSFPSPKART